MGGYNDIFYKDGTEREKMVVAERRFVDEKVDKYGLLDRVVCVWGVIYDIFYKDATEREKMVVAERRFVDEKVDKYGLLDRVVCVWGVIMKRFSTSIVYSSIKIVYSEL